ncbi:MAG: LPS export ABC transporter periplasmic protein LptC [Acidiferrobacterales bacterium]
MSWDLNKLMIALILLVLLVLAVWLPNALITPVISINANDRHEPDYVIQNFTVTAMNEQGRPKYVLSARTLVHFPYDKSATLTEPHLIQFTPGEAAVSTIADSGRVYNNGKELLMTGHVKVVRGQKNDQPGGDISTRELRIELD